MIKFVPPPNRILRNSVFGVLAALLLIIPLELSAREITARSATLPTHPLPLADCIAIALGECPTLEATHCDLIAAGQEIRSAGAICRYPQRRTAEGIAPSDRCRGCHKTAQ